MVTFLPQMSSDWEAETDAAGIPASNSTDAEAAPDSPKAASSEGAMSRIAPPVLHCTAKHRSYRLRSIASAPQMF
jgi:hypothetical protein